MSRRIRGFRWAILATVVGAACCGAGVASADAQSWDREVVGAAVDSIANAVVGPNGVAGMSVAVARGADLLLVERYGWADADARVATPAAAVYEIGSLTKQFTAVAILRLAEEGRLSLDDELWQHLPAYQGAARQVRIGHLLSHTAGVPDFSELPGFPAVVAAGATRKAIVDLFATEPLLFTPGEAMIYSNSGYVLLGLVIEAVTGIDYGEHVRRAVLEPAGMLSSGYCSPDPRSPRRVLGHGFAANGRMLPTEPLDHSWPFAAGSLCSTAVDLLAWNRAIHQDGMLSDSAHRLLTRPGRLSDGTPLRYGAGLMVDSILGRPALHHGGSIPGFRSFLAYFPEDSLGIAVLLNTAGPVSPNAIGRQIAETLYGPAIPHSEPLDRQARDFVGEYRSSGRDGTRVVTVDRGPAGELTVTIDGRRPELLRYLGANRFAARDVRLTFLDDRPAPRLVRFDEVAENVLLTRVVGR
ncbi:MAG: serine hydrolase domain-containing protein [Gemmatimonadota bacterium]